MPKKPTLRKLVSFLGAILTGVALYRFTSGDWLGGVILAAAVAGMAAWYLLTQRRPRDSRRY